MTQPYQALLLDLSGVLYEGSRKIEGAVVTVREARRRNLVLRFVTNTASKSTASILADLRRMDFQLEDHELFTAPMAARSYIKRHQLRPYCLVHDSIKEDFARIDQSNPNCVVLGDARFDLNYQNLNHAFQLCKQGAILIGIGMNKYFKDDEELKLDAGGFIRAIEWAADVQAIITGKPSSAFFDEVVASTGCEPNQCLMIGDDVFGDVQGAINSGLQGCLVKTGKFQASDLKQLPAQATAINSIKSLFSSSGFGY